MFLVCIMCVVPCLPVNYLLFVDKMIFYRMMGNNVSEKLFIFAV